MHRNGFTLVELMVVLLVMALIASAVMLTMPGGDRGLARDAAKFASRVAAARESAITTARPVSVWIGRSGYAFEARSGGRWVALDTKPFETVDWPDGTAVSSTGLASQAAQLSGDAGSRLIFDSLGLPEAPMTVSLKREGAKADVTVEANGDVKVG